MKKWFACTLALLLLFCLGQTLPQARAAETASGKAGELTWKLDKNGTMTISGTGDMPAWESESKVPWNAHLEKIKALVIEEGVTNVGPYAFMNCVNLKDVSLPRSVKVLDIHAFDGCSSLRFLTIPTGVKQIREAALNSTQLYCLTFEGNYPVIHEKAMEHVGWNNESHAFYPANNSTWPFLHSYGGNMSWEPLVEEVSGKASATTTWTLNIKTGLLTISGTGSMEYKYHYHDSPWDAYRPYIKAVVVEEGVEGLGAYCLAELKEPFTVTLPNSLSDIGANAFFGSSGLQAIILPQDLQRIYERAFFGTGLKELSIPAGVQFDGHDTFAECTSLKKLTIAPVDFGYAYNLFRGCTALTDVTLQAGLTKVVSGMFSECISLKSIVLPDTILSVDSGAFQGCTSLTDVRLSAKLERLGDKAFAQCTSLKEITLPASLKEMDARVFDDTDSMTAIYFLGDAPTCTAATFQGFRKSCYYPAGNATWTKQLMNAVGQGFITWKTGTHTCTFSKKSLPPTCTDRGYTYQGCICGKTKDKKQTDYPLGHIYDDGTCIRCGKEGQQVISSGAIRMAGSHRYETAFLAADQMRSTLGIQKFDTVVVASGTDFADALSGSYLAAVKNAPILLASGVDWVDAQVKEYISLFVKPGGTVYVLGGTKAIPAAFEEGLEAFTVTRLAGDNRFQTNLKVLEEAGVEGKSILACTGLGFADSLSASAAKQPILLVYGEKLLPEQEAFLAENQGSPLYVIGGTGAVSSALEEQIKTYGEVTRLAGDSRFETSVMIAETFFQYPTQAVLAYAWDFPDGLCGGSLAAAMNAPLILTMKNYEQNASEYVQYNYINRIYVLGGEKLIPDASVEIIKR